MKKTDRITTSQALNQIRKCGTFQEVLAESDKIEEPSFNQALYEVMSEKRIKPRDVIARTSIDRSYFYHILSGKKLPSKNVVMRLALAIGCTLNETNRLLRLAGLSNLYAKMRRDSILIYAIDHKASMQETNEMLMEAEEEPLYSERNLADV